SMAWFPGNHHPSDKATYDIRMTVPKGLGVVSNGELREERTRNGRTTFTWHTAEPMSSHVVTVAVGTWKTARSTTDDGLSVYTAVDPTQADASRKVLKRIPEIM
ncbi:M1 family metallopeptidase, partial [Streptomyces sp. SID6648]|nr:M1 family metallopeptidase [Streptomyces sp. SID6648]